MVCSGWKISYEAQGVVCNYIFLCMEYKDVRILWLVLGHYLLLLKNAYSLFASVLVRVFHRHRTNRTHTQTHRNCLRWLWIIEAGKSKICKTNVQFKYKGPQAVVEPGRINVLVKKNSLWLGRRSTFCLLQVFNWLDKAHHFRDGNLLY